MLLSMNNIGRNDECERGYKDEGEHDELAGAEGEENGGHLKKIRGTGEIGGQKIHC